MADIILFQKLVPDSKRNHWSHSKNNDLGEPQFPGAIREKSNDEQWSRENEVWYKELWVRIPTMIQRYVVF